MTNNQDSRNCKAVDNESQIAGSAEREMPRGAQIGRQPDRPAPEEDRVTRDGEHYQPEAMITPDAANAFENAAGRVLVLLDGTGVHEVYLGGVHRRVLFGLVSHQEPYHWQRQCERENAHGPELAPPADCNDQPLHDQSGEHWSDHAPDPPIGGRLAPLAQPKPVGDQGERDRITG